MNLQVQPPTPLPQKPVLHPPRPVRAVEPVLAVNQHFLLVQSTRRMCCQRMPRLVYLSFSIIVYFYHPFTPLHLKNKDIYLKLQEKVKLDQQTGHRSKELDLIEL